MGVELVPTPKAPKNWSLAIRLTAKIHQLRMLLFGRSARALKTLDMESSLKIAERASVKQISSHMNLHCPLPALQSAYKEYHSTETAMLKVLSDIRLDMDAQKVTMLVMLDLSAAFDTIDH